MQDQIDHNDQLKPQLNLIRPFSTFRDGKPVDIPYLIKGLLTEGGLSALSGKPKYGKASLARYAAVCVTKGIPFLGHDTTQSDVLLLSLEDQLARVDNCLYVLGHDPKNDGEIYIVNQLLPKLEDNIEELGNILTKHSGVRLMLVDILPKLIPIKDPNDYGEVQRALKPLHDLLSKFTRLHIQVLTHRKKTATEDTFDGGLGSTAFRGATDANIALYRQEGNCIIEAEGRGVRLEPTVLIADVIEHAGEEVVRNFYLDDRTLEERQEEKDERLEAKQEDRYKERIIEYLQGCDGYTDPQGQVLEKVSGNAAKKLAAIKALKEERILTIKGVPHSRTSPLTLTLDPKADTSKFGRMFAGAVAAEREAV